MVLLLEEFLHFLIYTHFRELIREELQKMSQKLSSYQPSFSLPKSKNGDPFCKTTYISSSYIKVEVLFTKVNNVPFVTHRFPNLFAIKVNS